MIAATAHDRFVVEDYERLRTFGMTVARDGIRWHLIEKTPYNYDFSSVLPMIRAARELGIQVIWDLCHYGFPDDLDIFKPEFVRRYASLTRAFTELHRNETDSIPFVAPINEISFFSWASGEVGYFYPFARRRGNELKTQLVRAAIEGIEAIWSVDPRARIVQIDPLINVVGRSARNQTAAENYRLSQYQAWDMLAGRLQPELGGSPKYLDIIGVNYYRDNQWFHPGGKKIARGHPLYRPLRSLLREVYKRYRRPIFIAETGTEFDARTDWLRYIGREARAAMRSGVPIEGICWYAIINCPGWDDERHCYNGLWDYVNEAGEREIYVPLVRELRRQMRLFGQIQTTQGGNLEMGLLEKTNLDDVSYDGRTV